MLAVKFALMLALEVFVVAVVVGAIVLGLWRVVRDAIQGRRHSAESSIAHTWPTTSGP